MTPCPCCHLAKAHLYCAKCLREGVETNHRITRALSNQCVDASIRAKRLIGGPRGLADWRRLRADVARAERTVAKLKEELDERHQELPTAPRRPHRPLYLPPAPFSTSLSPRLIHARKVLVREAISVFGIQRGKVWTIAGLPLPPPELFLDYPSATINAALTHAVHLVSLITMYLSIELPYLPFGRTITPNTPHVNTTAFRQASLWFSKKTAKHRAFLTAFALLCHSIAYLAYTQGVSGIVPTSILELLVALSESPTLGVRSHAPGTNQIRHLGFSLDVKEVVASVLRDSPAESEWDIVKLEDG